jgi:hypothetical protein
LRVCMHVCVCVVLTARMAGAHTWSRRELSWDSPCKGVVLICVDLHFGVSCVLSLSVYVCVCAPCSHSPLGQCNVGHPSHISARPHCVRLGAAGQCVAPVWCDWFADALLLLCVRCAWAGGEFPSPHCVCHRSQGRAIAPSPSASACSLQTALTPQVSAVV